MGRAVVWNGRTSSVPKTEFYQLVVNVKVVDVILEYCWFAAHMKSIYSVSHGKGLVVIAARR